MDARPNVLNKILPCYKRIFVRFTTSTSGGFTYNLINARALDPDTDELVSYMVTIPHDIKYGSDVLLIADGCPLMTNNTGADKKVRLVATYNYARNGEVIGAVKSGDITLITIPDGEAIYTMHKNGVLAIAGLRAGDFLAMRITRDADHTDDDYAGDWGIFQTSLLQYEIDKIGVLV